MPRAVARHRKQFRRSASPRKDQRLEVRINASQKALIERAAYLKGMNVTQFVTFSSYEAAINTIQEHESLILRDEARDVFISAIVNPPAPSTIEKAAVARYRSLVRTK